MPAPAFPSFPAIVVEVPHQLPPRAWLAHTPQDLIDACWPQVERSGDELPASALDAAVYLAADLAGFALIDQAAWAAYNAGRPRRVARLGLPVHQEDRAVALATVVALREGWPCPVTDEDVLALLRRARAEGDDEARAVCEQALAGGAASRAAAEEMIHDALVRG